MTTMGKALGSIVIVVLCLGSASAQTKLEWQLKKGETFLAERVYTQKQSVTVKGKTHKTERQKTWVSSISVKDKTAAGYVLELRFDKVEFQLGDDRAAPNKEGFDQKLAAKLIGTGYTALITKQGKLVKLLGYDAFVRKLVENEAGPEKTLRTLLSEDSLRDDLEEIFPLLPEKPVRAGDHWKRETTEPLPPFGSLHTTVDYALGTDRGDEWDINLTIKVAH